MNYDEVLRKINKDNDESCFRELDNFLSDLDHDMEDIFEYGNKRYKIRKRIVKESIEEEGIVECEYELKEI